MDFGRVFIVKPARMRFRNRLAPAFFFLLALLLSLPTILHAQSTIAGSVLKSDGEPIVGAQVAVVGTDMGTVSDRNGEYQIGGVPTGQHTVQVTFLGFRDESRTVNVSEGTTRLNFVLETAPIVLDAIFVTGTAGQVQRRSIGNAVTQIQVDEVLDKAPVINVSDLLTARSPGASVTTSSGTPGAGSSIRLRGTSSLTQSNEPLIYVDGVRIDNDPDVLNVAGVGIFTVGGQSTSRLNDFSPEDIESIEIIKGPAAATLYGTEAAAGVIQIITKKGRTGETRWNLRATLGQTDMGHLDFPDNFGSVANMEAVPDCLPVKVGNKEISASNCGLRVVETLSNGRVLIAQNPLEAIRREGTLQDYSLSASGGRETFTFFLSGNFAGEGGVLPANWTEKWSGRANFQWSPTGLFDVAVSTGYTNNEIRLPNSDNNIFGFFGNALLAQPANIRQTAAGIFAFGEPFTPLERVGLLDSRLTNDRFIGSVTANFNPYVWLSNRATFGVDLNAEENTQFAPFGALASLNPRGQKTNNRQTVFNVSFDYNGTVVWDLTESLRSNSSVGTQIYNENTDIVTASGRDFPGPGVSTVSAAAIKEAFEARIEETSVGVYFQEQVAWQNRLFVTGAVRFDDHSSFGDDFDFETYPKVSVAWILSEEPWFTLSPVSLVKLRTAYGYAGKQPAAFSEFREFTPVSIRAGVPTITPNQIGNPDLGPERSRELEVGFDANVWNDRIGIEYTYYDKVTEDALILKPNTPSLGFPGSQLFNLGEVQNSGHELGINGLVVDTDIVDYEFNLTLSTNDNEITDLGGVEPFPTPGSFDQRIEVGFPVSSYFDRVITGRNPDGSPIISTAEEFLGRVTPGNWGALGNTVTLWDNVRVYALVDWKRDFVVNDVTEQFRWSLGRNVRERIVPELLDTQEVKDNLALLANGSAAPWISEGDFVKLREVSVSYTLPGEWAQQLGARRAMVTVSGRNLKTWTDYSGVDPEVNVFGAANIVSSDFLTVPQSRRLLLTFDLTW